MVPALLSGGTLGFCPSSQLLGAVWHPSVQITFPDPAPLLELRRLGWKYLFVPVY